MPILTPEELKRKSPSNVISTEIPTGDQEEDDKRFLTDEEIDARRRELIKVKPTDFVKFSIKLPNKRNQTLEPFSFEGREYLKEIYDSSSKKILLKSGRQTEKSTLLGNKTLAYSCIINSFNTLYVSPTNQQTKTFSQDRLREPIETSPILKSWTTTRVSDSIFHKRFINRSQIYLRYAYHTADRCRGIPSDKIVIDELQDILTDNIPVIEECSSHSLYKLFTYSGTPKSYDNTIEQYWIEQSTQNEWMVPCERHLPVFWNILDERNIDKKGLVCSKCRELINPGSEKAKWVSMNPNIRTRMSEPFEGYRIPQLMVPWIDWNYILDKYNTLSRSVFYNEVLGLSFDSGTKPLTRQDVIDNCDPELVMTTDSIKSVINSLGGAPIFAGIDWGGGGSHSFTVISLGAYYKNKFTIFYIHRFEGEEEDSEIQLKIIEKIINNFNVSLVGVDNGGGKLQIDVLQRKFGRNRIVPYQYSSTNKKITWNPELHRFIVHRTEVMTDIFAAIKRRDFIRFPSWDYFEDPFGSDMLNIFSEYSERSRQTKYDKSPSVSDDSFHSILYCVLASMLQVPRHDILNPTQKTNSVIVTLD